MVVASRRDRSALSAGVAAVGSQSSSNVRSKSVGRTSTRAISLAPPAGFEPATGHGIFLTVTVASRVKLLAVSVVSILALYRLRGAMGLGGRQRARTADLLCVSQNQISAVATGHPNWPMGSVNPSVICSVGRPNNIMSGGADGIRTPGSLLATPRRFQSLMGLLAVRLQAPVRMTLLLG